MLYGPDEVCSEWQELGNETQVSDKPVLIYAIEKRGQNVAAFPTQIIVSPESVCERKPAMTGLV